MAIADRSGLPLAICVESATPHEVTLVERTIDACLIDEEPEKLIGDKAYDSDRLDARLKERGVDLIAPNITRADRRRTRPQDKRPLRRYRRRWLVERLFAWLQNFRRLVTRWERSADNFRGFVWLGCIVILMRRLP